jgi:hypothetical protein
MGGRAGAGLAGSPVGLSYGDRNSKGVHGRDRIEGGRGCVKEKVWELDGGFGG